MIKIILIIGIICLFVLSGCRQIEKLYKTQSQEETDIREEPKFVERNGVYFADSIGDVDYDKTVFLKGISFKELTDFQLECLSNFRNSLDKPDWHKYTIHYDDGEFYDELGISIENCSEDSFEIELTVRVGGEYILGDLIYDKDVNNKWFSRIWHYDYFEIPSIHIQNIPVKDINTFKIYGTDYEDCVVRTEKWIPIYEGDKIKEIVKDFNEDDSNCHLITYTIRFYNKE